MQKKEWTMNESNKKKKDPVKKKFQKGKQNSSFYFSGQKKERIEKNFFYNIYSHAGRFF